MTKKESLIKEIEDNSWYDLKFYNKKDKNGTYAYSPEEQQIMIDRKLKAEQDLRVL